MENINIVHFIPEARKCLKQEEKRAKSIFWSLKALRAFVEGKSDG